MRPSSFDYHKATSLDHALALLAEFGEEGRPIAGGQSLVPMMNLRLARPGHLVDINALPLDGIERRGDILHVGALVRHHRYLADPLIATHFPAFLEAVHWIGHPTIRNHGSLGGSISHADPTAELPAVCLLYDATIIASSTAGDRRIAARDFFLGAYVTSLEPGEMVTAVEFPIPPAASTGAFVELGERRGDFAIASVGVVLHWSGRQITRAAVVCSGAKLVPIRAGEIEALLVGRQLDAPDAAAAGRRFADSVEPASDHSGSSSYRKHLIGELTRRTIERACQQALDIA